MSRIYGNNALESYEEERASVRYRRMRQEQLQQEEERQKELHRAQVQQKKRIKEPAAKLDFISIFWMVTTLMVVGFVCVSYLQVQESITAQTKEIASVENELAELKTENDIAHDKVEATVDLSEIYKIATKELGMVHAKKDKVIPYSEVKSDFVKQYGEIPD